MQMEKICDFLGFDATSNLLAGKLFGIPVKGTQAHSFISSFSTEADLKVRELVSKLSGETVDVFEFSKAKLKELIDAVSDREKEIRQE